MTTKKIPIAVADGDGIGPEIMNATLHILKSAQVPLEFHPIEIGEKVYLRGHPTGIEQSTWDILRQTRAFLKAPITTPQGGGFKSLNVTIRTTLGLYANVRPCVAYAPYIATKHPGMNVVIVRENEEDLYTGVEYRGSSDTVIALKMISRTACEKIIRYAFEYAQRYNRKKVTCFTKDNILKLTDGLFHKIFDEIAAEYPQITNEHWIIDIGAAKLADTPTVFDVIVMPNLYGDILSDVAAQIAGSVGLAGSANIGQHGAMFEAIHGSAPRRAGQNLANPSGLLQAAIMMLVHLDLVESASLIQNAWLKTLEDGIHTYDVYEEGISKEKVGTKEFAENVVKRLGQKPLSLQPASYRDGTSLNHKESTIDTKRSHKKTVGVDVFIDFKGNVEELHTLLNVVTLPDLRLTMISNRGVMVWPTILPETTCTDQWRCRFMSESKGSSISHEQIALLLQNIAKKKIDFIHIENLCEFDGKPGYTVAQNEQ